MKESFTSRHIGASKKDQAIMVETIKARSIDALISETIPASIRTGHSFNIPDAMTEHEYLAHISSIARKNIVFKSYLGMGYYHSVTPPVILRNIFENPGWYTAYTPYQAEISQGRLEALLNFQTMVTDLTGMEIANGSLLDEATAAAEAMTMLFGLRTMSKMGGNLKNQSSYKFFVSENCFPQTIAVLLTRAEPLGIEVITGDHNKIDLTTGFFGALVQYPDAKGALHDFRNFSENAHRNGVKLAVAADLLSLSLLTPPGEWGADVVIGSTQRFGIPMCCGGPHAAYFAAKDEYKRNMPGRIIGVTVDAEGNRALRMALQTREQHIRREKATSNICTSQVLLAVMASMYAVYHGPQGLKAIASRIHNLAFHLSECLKKAGYTQINDSFFDTLCIRLTNKINIEDVRKCALAAKVNLRYENENTICISIDEATTEPDIEIILSLFSDATAVHTRNQLSKGTSIPVTLTRKSPFLIHPVFNSFHSETEMMRYIKSLENKDLTLTNSMIPLGSCTMKLNAAAELLPLSWKEFADIHPFAPDEQLKGYQCFVNELEKYLCAITGFAAVSFQPNSGAQGEYTGLLVIRAYHKSRGESTRNTALIPSSAHGTNPASAVMAGMKVVIVQCDAKGNIDENDLLKKAEEHSKDLAVLMVTYPSTHGVFEENITEITRTIHQCGGLVYMDGANLNAQVCLTTPAAIGADVCHLNLHKTFAIPHGGGGPGMGPIAVTDLLKPFLPTHPLLKSGEKTAISAISASPWSSALILLISYGYIRMLGKTGLSDATKQAILSANYIAVRLGEHYPVLFEGKNGRVAHEMIIDCRSFKKSAGVEVEDIAKRLIDYGFHAPTVSFPVAGTMMIEPTESESLAEIDRFCETMIAIREEIREIEQGIADHRDNVLKNAPHTALCIASDAWNHSYSRMKAAYPLPWLRSKKYWSPVRRVDNAYGDRNLVCTCARVEEYDVEKELQKT